MAQSLTLPPATKDGRNSSKSPQTYFAIPRCIRRHRRRSSPLKTAGVAGSWALLQTTSLIPSSFENAPLRALPNDTENLNARIPLSAFSDVTLEVEP